MVMADDAATGSSPDGWAIQATGTTATLYGIWGTGPGDVFAVGDNGTVLHYDGAAWSPMDSGVSAVLYDVWGSGSGDVFAVGQGGAICHYDGIAWGEMSSGTGRHLQGVWGTDNHDVYAVGYGGTILHYDGLSWSEMENGNTSHLKAIWGSSSTDIFAAGNNGVVLHYDGVTWSTMLENTHPNFEAMWGSASDNVLAVGGGGMILRYDGASWVPTSSGASVELTGVWGTSPSDVFVVGLDGTVLHYDGSGWGAMDSGITGSLWSVWGFSSTDVFAAGFNGTTLHFREMPPLVGTVSPNVGNQGQTLEVTINGSDLDRASYVDFGPDIQVDSYRAEGPDQITAAITIKPAAAPGPRDVSVANPCGTGSLPGAFTIPAPSVNGISPEHGEQGQTLEVTITGSNLGRTTAVSLGDGISVGALAVQGPARLVATISIDGGATSGVRDVVTTTPEGVCTLPGGFCVGGLPPSLSAVNPSSGKQGQTLEVLMLGANLAEATGIAFGDGISVVSFTAQGPGSLAGTILISATAPLGTRDVSITTVDGSAILEDAFSVAAEIPVISDVSPRSGQVGQTISLTITGAHLADTSNIDFGPGIVVESYEAGSPDQVTATVTISWDAAVGARDVSVTTPGGRATLAEGFTPLRLPPGILGINPAQGEVGETLDVIITGTGFSGATRVDFGEGIAVNRFTVDSDTRITANITILSRALRGLRNVRIETPAGSVDFPAGFDLTIDGSSGNSPQQGSTAEPSASVPVAFLVLGGIALVAVACGALLLARRLRGSR